MTVEEITAACGVSKGTFYNYFTSKDDFVLFIEHSSYEDTSQEIADAPDRPLEEQIALYIQRFFQRVAKCSPAYYVRWISREVLNEGPTGDDSMFTLNSGHIRACIEGAVAKGELVADAPVDDLVRMTVVSIYGTSAVGYIAPDRFDAIDWAKRLPSYLACIYAYYKA